MDSTQIYVVAFAPAYRCYTTEYNNYVILYILTLTILISLVLLIFVASFKFQRKFLSSTQQQFDEDSPYYFSSYLNRDDSVERELGIIHRYQNSLVSCIEGDAKDTKDERNPCCSFRDFVYVWTRPYQNGKLWWVGMDFIFRLTYIIFFTFLLKFIQPGTQIRFSLGVLSLM